MERRRYRRIFFSMEDGPTALFTHVRFSEEAVTATIMDMSIGGLGMTLKKDGNTFINIGDLLRLNEIRGLKNSQFLNNVEMEIRWIQNYDALQHVLFGCEFTDISTETEEQIQEFIDLWADTVTGSSI
ncbi:PilZ domain-containing protein [Desulfococcaceae bacterium HSG8]|nr:PilZ domain-containing protein [Desulfococcaceae bacterium HSG8]